MMMALFRYIHIPDPWFRVLCQILSGPVLFLVGGDVVREEQLLPWSCIRQGDPLSPIFFSLLMSPVVFVLRRHGLEVWLYSDDALPRILCLWMVLAQTVQSVLDNFSEVGAFTSLRLNLRKTKALLQGVGLRLVQLSGIQVVSSVKYLGALFGDVSPAEKVVGVFESMCLHISRMPLFAKERVQPVHTWCYPVLQVIGVAFYPPQSVLVRLRAALQVAFGSRNWKMTLDILHLPPSDRGWGFGCLRFTSTLRIRRRSSATCLGLCRVTHCVIGWRIKALFIPCLIRRCCNSRLVRRGTLHGWRIGCARCRS